MRRTLLALAIATLCAGSIAFGQTVSTGNGGAGGAGGSAAGGQATGGSAVTSTNTSGVSNAVGGSAQGGTGGSASGGQSTSTASGGNVGTVSTGGSNASLGDFTVNYNAGSSPMGKDGLGVGVDPETGHVVTDNTVKYSGSYKLKNTPDVSVGGPASGPCNGFSGGLGFSMAGMAIGANASTVDEGCTARETARVAAMIGRMDIANAVLENLPAVQAALRSKAAREAAVLNAPRSDGTGAASPAVTRPAAEDPKVAATREAAQKAQKELERAVKEAALKDQQNQATEALARNATMNKTWDTLRFTDAESQLVDKTPQQLLAEESLKKLQADATVAVEKKTSPPEVTAEQTVDKPKADVQQTATRKDTQQSQQPGQQAVTTPLPMPTPVQAQQLQSQPQLQASAQQLVGAKSDSRSDLQGSAKSALRTVDFQGAAKGSEKAAQSTEDRMKAARSAFNLR